MLKSAPFRVIVAALALSTLSFAAGVAGDLSMIDPPRSGVSVVLRIPPELPPDTPRAAPLPPMASQPASLVAPRRPVRRAAQPPVVVAESVVTPQAQTVEPKPLLVAARPDTPALVLPRKHKISYV